MSAALRTRRGGGDERIASTTALASAEKPRRSHIPPAHALWASHRCREEDFVSAVSPVGTRQKSLVKNCEPTLDAPLRSGTHVLRPTMTVPEFLTHMWVRSAATARLI